MSRKVVWTKRARSSLNVYCDYIANEAPQAAKRVRKEIVQTARILSKNPFLYQIDEYYPDNPGNIRRFFKWDYRAVYQVKEKEVVILDILHTSIHPDEIK